MEYLIEKYLGEAHDRGVLKLLPTRNPKKLKEILKKNKIQYSETNKGIMVGNDDYDKAEELMARNLLF